LPRASIVSAVSPNTRLNCRDSPAGDRDVAHRVELHRGINDATALDDQISFAGAHEHVGIRLTMAALAAAQKNRRLFNIVNALRSPSQLSTLTNDAP
jgi:hypothetical protein